MLGAGLLVLGGLAAPMPAAAQTVEAGNVEIDLSGEVQIQFNTTSVTEEEVRRRGFFFEGEIPRSTFETRRVRLALDIAIDDWITARIQPDMPLGRLFIRDAWINLAFDPAIQLKVGQFLKPFSRIQLMSATTLLAIERGVRIRGMESAFRAEFDPDDRRIFGEFGGALPLGEENLLLDALGYLGRDIGAAVHGTRGRFDYMVGIFNGNGADDFDDTGEKSYTGRLEWRPRENVPLSVAAAVSYRELFLGDEVDAILRAGERDGIAFEVDAEWGEFRRPGLHAVVEAAIGDNYAPIRDPGRFESILGADDQTFVGVQGQATYFLPLGDGRLQGVEPVGRISYGDSNLDGSDDSGLLITPGVNVYSSGRNRLMVNWDFFVSDFVDIETENAFRAQAQIHF